MNYAVIKKNDIANGVGVRVSLFVSGCRHRCKNCFNKEAWDFGYGEEYTSDTRNEILEAANHSYVDGLSLLGGEPFEPENIPALTELTKKFKEAFPEKNIWCYSGFSFGELIKRPDARELLEQTDVLVDGRFKEELKNPCLLFRGSSNQNIIDVQKSLKENTKVLLDGVWERKMGSNNIYEV